MASLDWSECPVVECIAGTVSGAWVFKGTVCLWPRSSRTSRISASTRRRAVRRDARTWLLTTDRRIRYQQNLQGRRIAVVVLTRNRVGVEHDRRSAAWGVADAAGLEDRDS